MSTTKQPGKSGRKRKVEPKPKDTAEDSKWIEVRGSEIHGRGLFAIRKIPKETDIIEYVGEKIDKEESDRRGWELYEAAQATGGAAVYLFTLNDEFDIDGDVEWNSARLINHSCDPNCEAVIDGDQIWITALRKIKKSDEIFFNYGFDLENYEGHPCRCGTERCMGYIAGEEYWPELKKLIKKAKQAGKKQAKLKKQKLARK